MGRKNSISTGAENILRDAGLRATKPRVSVLSYLEKSHSPLSIKKLSAAFLHIDTVTLYRMMDTFVDAGIVSRIDLGHGHAHYEIKGDDHHHIVCVNCDKIEDFHDDAHTRLEKKILSRSRSFNRIINHSFELFGVCNTCSTIR